MWHVLCSWPGPVVPKEICDTWYMIFYFRFHFLFRARITKGATETSEARRGKRGCSCRNARADIHMLRTVACCHSGCQSYKATPGGGGQKRCVRGLFGSTRPWHCVPRGDCEFHRAAYSVRRMISKNNLIFFPLFYLSI